MDALLWKRFIVSVWKRRMYVWLSGGLCFNVFFYPHACPWSPIRNKENGITLLLPPYLKSRVLFASNQQKKWPQSKGLVTGVFSYQSITYHMILTCNMQFYFVITHLSVHIRCNVVLPIPVCKLNWIVALAKFV